MKGTLFSSQVAEPYAQALMSLAQAHNLTEALGEEVRSLLRALEESPEFAQVLASPVVQDEVKKAILKRVLGEGANPFLSNFLMLLVDKRRLVCLPFICEEYLKLLRQLTNTVLAEVVCAQDLTDDQRQAVTNKIKELTGASAVELKTSVDPDLIGGVTIKVGSQIYDASLRGQLRRISYSLMNAS